jgi:cytochrome c oxidase assembly protein subunit 11
MDNWHTGSDFVRHLNILRIRRQMKPKPVKPLIEIANLNKRLAWRLSLIVLAGLLFGFAISPIYDVMCKKFALNGRADSSATAFDKTIRIDKSRWVTVIFTGNTMPGLVWSFHPSQTSLRIHPGEITLTSYEAKNNAVESELGVAVPSVTPELAALYFKKIECFCFKQQTLKPGENRKMPVMFYVKPDLPSDVHTVTLSYAFYNGLPSADKAALNQQGDNAVKLN